jgi:hypothetical protein
MTTFLYDSEKNQKTNYPEVNQLLDKVRHLTGEDWQLVPINITTKKWYKTTHETFWGLYVYVGGVGPYQQINFFNCKSNSSINIYVPIGYVANYLMGIVAGYHIANNKK